MNYIIRHNRIIDAVDYSLRELEESYVCPVRMLSVDHMYDFLKELSSRKNTVTKDFIREVCDRYHLNPDNYETFEDLYNAIKPF